MAAESFFARWSRRKAEASAEEPSRPDAGPTAGGASDAAVAPDEASLPTLADAERLTPDSDFSAFIARGVDQAVRRKALKTLFSDPHFNVMDRLDIYIDDYNRVEPLPAAILAKLSHAQSVLNPVPLWLPAPPAPADADAAGTLDTLEAADEAAGCARLPSQPAEAPGQEENAGEAKALAVPEDPVAASEDGSNAPAAGAPDTPAAPVN